MDAQTTLTRLRKIRESYLQPLSGRLAAIEESIHAFCEEFRKAAVAVGDCRKFVGAGSTARACAGPRTEKTVNLVNLFATARDKNKRIVGDMRQDDFKIFEDGPGTEDRVFLKRSDYADHPRVAD